MNILRGDHLFNVGEEDGLVAAYRDIHKDLTARSSRPRPVVQRVTLPLQFYLKGANSARWIKSVYKGERNR